MVRDWVDRTHGFLQAGSLRITTERVLASWTDQMAFFAGAASLLITIPSRYSLAVGEMSPRLRLGTGVSLAAYMIASLANGTSSETSPYRARKVRPAHLWADINNHARLRFRLVPMPRAITFSRAAYASVLFVMLPLIISLAWPCPPRWRRAGRSLISLVEAVGAIAPL